MRTATRREMLRSVAAASAAFVLTHCAPTAPEVVQRIGWLSVLPNVESNKPQVDAFRERMAELGYVEGRDVNLVFRFTGQQAELTESLVGELRSLQVRVIVGHGTATAAKPFLGGTAFVMAIAFDPVELGNVESLARPGGSITGVASVTSALISKRLELLKEVAPRVSHVGLLRNAFAGAINARVLAQAREDGARSGFSVDPVDIDTQRREPTVLADTFISAAAAGIDGLVATYQINLLNDNRQLLAEITAQHRLPTIYAEPSPVEGGGLASLGADQREHVRRAAGYVDKILKGANPAELPIDIPEQVEIALNLTAAQRLSLSFPPSVLARANRVIK